MKHWLLDAMAEQRRRALHEADCVQFYQNMGGSSLISMTNCCEKRPLRWKSPCST